MLEAFDLCLTKAPMHEKNPPSCPPRRRRRRALVGVVVVNNLPVLAAVEPRRCAASTFGIRPAGPCTILDKSARTRTTRLKKLFLIFFYILPVKVTRKYTNNKNIFFNLVVLVLKLSLIIVSASSGVIAGT